MSRPRGLRRVVPVRSTTSGTKVVGRHGEALLAAYEDPEVPIAELDQLGYGLLVPDVEDLRKRVRDVRVRVVARRSKVPRSTLADWVAGAASSEDVVLAAAMTLEAMEAEPVRICALAGCEHPARPKGKWCSDGHRAKGSRVNRGLVGWGTQRPTWAREAALERAWQEPDPE